ncbi:MAG: hypothetical protein ABI876_05560 [Bacteroidota bacterium]
MRTRQIILAACCAALTLAAAAEAQERPTSHEDEPSTIGVVIGVKTGLLVTTPRQIFPSVRIGDSFKGTAPLSSSYGTLGSGYRYGLDFIFPFNERIGMAVELGVQTADVRWNPVTGSGHDDPAMRLELQTMQAAISVQGNLYHNRAAFADAGLRTVYLTGGFDLGIGSIANRVEGPAYADSTALSAAAVGSFENGEPFRRLVAFRGGAGARLGLGGHMELSLEAAYALALNPVFSSEVVHDNSFTFDNLALQVGLGYRF